MNETASADSKPGDISSYVVVDADAWQPVQLPWTLRDARMLGGLNAESGVS